MAPSTRQFSQWTRHRAYVGCSTYALLDAERPLNTWTDISINYPPFLMHLITESIFFCIIQMIQLWHYWEIGCSISINNIFFHCFKNHIKWGGWCKEESFSDYTVLNGCRHPPLDGYMSVCLVLPIEEYGMGDLTLWLIHTAAVNCVFFYCRNFFVN